MWRMMVRAKSGAGQRRAWGTEEHHSLVQWIFECLLHADTEVLITSGLSFDLGGGRWMLSRPWEWALPWVFRLFIECQALYIEDLIQSLQGHGEVGIISPIWQETKCWRRNLPKAPQLSSGRVRIWTQASQLLPSWLCWEPTLGQGWAGC